MSERGRLAEALRADAEKIIAGAISAVLPDAAVERALQGKRFPGRVYLVAAGKAAWQMANTARACLQDNFCGGVVVTKYGHVKGEIADIVCFEGGHPIPDENSLRGTDAALALTEDLTESDTVVFLLSGGGSALFEKPLLPLSELQDVTGQLLAAGADIVEINTIRKRLSAVKGGRFAQHCAPARVFAVVLSDVLGDPLDMIASGPAYPDASNCGQAIAVAKKYGLHLSEQAWELLAQETPKTLTNVETQITGSVRELCTAAAAVCETLGYEPSILTDCLCCEAREAGSMLAAIARTHAREGKDLAFLMGGETVVHLRGGASAGAIRSLRSRPRSASRGFRTRSSSPSAPTGRTGRPTLRAASPTARPRSFCAKRGSIPQKRLRKMIRTTHLLPPVRLSKPARRVRMSTILLSCCCAQSGAGNLRPDGGVLQIKRK